MTEKATSSGQENQDAVERVEGAAQPLGVVTQTQAPAFITHEALVAWIERLTKLIDEKATHKELSHTEDRMVDRIEKKMAAVLTIVEGKATVEFVRVVVTSLDECNIKIANATGRLDERIDKIAEDLKAIQDGINKLRVLDAVSPNATKKTLLSDRLKDHAAEFSAKSKAGADCRAWAVEAAALEAEIERLKASAMALRRELDKRVEQLDLVSDHWHKVFAKEAGGVVPVVQIPTITERRETDSDPAGSSSSRLTCREKEADELRYLRALDKLRQEAGISAAMLRDGRAKALVDRSLVPRYEWHPMDVTKIARGAYVICEIEPDRGGGYVTGSYDADRNAIAVGGFRFAPDLFTRWALLEDVLAK